MGDSVTWMAVRGMPASKLLQEVELKATGERTAICEAEFTGAQLTNGWYVIVALDLAEFMEGAVPQRLSQTSEIVICALNEGAMFSCVEQRRHGKLIFSAYHDPSENITHLEVEGTPPASFATLKQEALADQQKEDSGDYVFNVPIALAEELTGFNHGGCSLFENAEAPYEVLDA